MDRNLVIQARRANIEEYFKSKGVKLKKEGLQYRVPGHSGLVISKNKWYSHTLQEGGNTLDYLVKVEKMDFTKAVNLLSDTKAVMFQKGETREAAKVSIPKRNADDKRVIAYLVKARGIDKQIILPLLKQGRIYESDGTHNCIMTGIDDSGAIRYVMQRSTLDKSSFKYESKGSDKRYSFSLKGVSDTLYVFESPIDLLSYITLQRVAMKSGPHLLSLGGIASIALDAYIERYPYIKNIVLALDNDEAGCKGCASFLKRYSARQIKTYTHLPKSKDWNTELLINNNTKGMPYPGY